MLGERNAFIRTLYNTYGIEADRETGWFREHAASLFYPPKSFEEAQFLNRLLAGVIYESGERLFLFAGAPDTWYEKGFSAAGMPTHFGEVDLKVEREGGTVRAWVKMKRTAGTQAVRMTLRHSGGGAIRSLRVNGAESRDFDAKTSFITLDPTLDKWVVEAQF